MLALSMKTIQPIRRGIFKFAIHTHDDNYPDYIVQHSTIIIINQSMRM